MFAASPGVDIVMGARVKMLGRDTGLPDPAIAAARSRRPRQSRWASASTTPVRHKIFGTDPVRQAFTAPFRSKWIFDVEILSRYLATTGTAQADSHICVVPLKTWTAMPGSKLTLWHAVRAIWDLALISR